MAMLTAALSGCLLGPTAAAAQAAPTLSSALSAAPAFTVTDDSFSDDKARQFFFLFWHCASCHVSA